MRVASILLLVFCVATGAAAQTIHVASPNPTKPPQTSLSQVLARGLPVEVATSPRGVLDTPLARAAAQPPYRPSSPPNKNTRGMLIFAGTVVGMCIGGYTGYVMETRLAGSRGIRGFNGVYVGGAAGGALGALAVWKLTR